MIDQPLNIAPLPPEQAIAYFRGKGFQLSWDWHDMWQAEHARAFTVAKVTKVGILQDIRAALDKALADGTTFEQFKKDLIPTLQRKGWWGKQDAIDTGTGELRTVQLGNQYRLRTIFDVNIQTSLQVGHYRAMTDPAVLKARPYWRYSAVMDGKTRPMHRLWNGTILPADSPWWQSHYPPNGWNCRCTVVSMSRREIDRAGLQVAPEPEQKFVDWTNPGTGMVERIPEGIDPGWAYNPGQAAAAQTQAVAGEKVMTTPQPLRWQLLNDLRAEDIGREFDAWTTRLLDPANQFAPGKYKTTGAITTVDHLSQNLVERLAALDQVPETTAITITDREWFHAQHGEQPAESGRKPGNILTRDQALKLPELMRNAKAVLWDKTDPALLYVFDAPENKSGKLVVRVNFRNKQTGEIGNALRTGELLTEEAIQGQIAGKHYQILEGKM